MAGNEPHNIRHLFLVGMPAAGKTYWGEKIAQHHSLPFIDLDAVIVANERMDIPSLFMQFGEEGFRQREHRYLENTINSRQEACIIACGGGTPCFHDNMTLMNNAGITIYLQADIAYLLKNINEHKEGRPLLSKAKDNLMGYLAEMLKNRKTFYELAQYILPVEDISLSTFEKIMLHV